MEDVKKFILKGNLRSALDILVERGVDDSLLILSRLNSLERELYLGIISNQDALLERNRISHSVLSLIGEHDIPFNQHERKNDNNGSYKHVLTNIIIENKRRNPEISKEAKNLLDEFQGYFDAKLLNPSFDPSQRRYKQLELNKDNFLKKIAEIKDDSIENFSAAISELLSENAPSIPNLKKAYSLLIERGMKDLWIEEVLERMDMVANDEEMRILIAEKIEKVVFNYIRG